MSLIILFGLPGAGKTFVGKVFERYFDYYFYDGDNDLTEEMKEAIKVQKVFTDRMRDIFFKRLINKIQKLLALSVYPEQSRRKVEGKLKHKKLVVAQTFIKEKYRLNLISKITETKFVLVETKKSIREKRLSQRKDYPLEMEYTRKIELNFDKPIIDHLKIINDIDGVENIKKQIKKFSNH